jgi:stage II sporulation protein D
VSFSGFRSLELLYKNKPQGFKGLKTKGLIFCGTLLLIVLSAACGKHKVQVKAPAPRAASTDAERGKKSPDQQTPSIASKPLEASPYPEATAGESSPPETEGAIPSIELSAGPMIRIGLTTTAKEVRISSSGAYFLMEKIPEASRKPLRGEIHIRVEQGGERNAIVYQVQVASFAKLENAEDMQKTLAGQFTETITIRENSATGTNQVRMGEFQERSDAQSFLKTVVDSGYPDAFIVKETLFAGDGKKKLALRGPDSLFRLSEAGFLFMPSSGSSFLCVDGKPYRGLLDVIINKGGRITVVNEVGIEDYLDGVVPAEINPAVYPENAALAAQAIAARTYALKNMGRFRSEGFDLSDDTRTQVYGGVGAEKDATNDVVRQTHGMAIYYQDKLIDAMYMSTCGGRTEDYANVFDTAPVPYLKSVTCEIESTPEKGEMILQGEHKLEQSILSDDGSMANRNLELADILGLIEFDSKPSPEFLAARIEHNEAMRWIENAKKIAQQAPTGESPAVANVDTRAGFLRFAAESFFGADEIRRRISPRSAEYYIGNLKDGRSVSESDRYALAYLMQSGLWRPYSDNTVRPGIPIRRCDAISLLLRFIESVRPGILRKGTLVEAGLKIGDSETDSVIRVKWGNQIREFPLSKDAFLFRLDSGQTTPVNSLRIIGNEKIAFHVSPSGIIDFLEVELCPTGTSSDRYSPAATWDVTFSRSVLADKLDNLTGNIGTFIDLKPARIGNSGRVVQIEVIGSRGSIVMNGYRFRNALGLKDTLYTIKRERNADGSIASFIFSGRGWGHGVGLCQVGAFGMARAGHSYKEILKTYYQGVEIRRAY